MGKTSMPSLWNASTFICTLAVSRPVGIRPCPIIRPSQCCAPGANSVGSSSSRASILLCDQMRTISKDRLGKAPWGTVSAATLAEVDRALRVLLGL